MSFMKIGHQSRKTIAGGRQRFGQSTQYNREQIYQMKGTKGGEESEDVRSLNELIHQTYSCLEKKYSDSNNAREVDFLKNYINVLDRISDELIYAQEKFLSIDTEKIKDDKCINYASQIAINRSECFSLKDKIKKANLRLHAEQMKRDKLERENENLRQICKKKTRNLTEYRSFFSVPKCAQEPSVSCPEQTAKTDAPVIKFQVRKRAHERRVDSLLLEPAEEAVMPKLRGKFDSRKLGSLWKAKD